MAEFDLFIRFGVAIAIGFFIGLQREFSHGGEGKTIPAGERTFALLALSGALAAMGSEQFRQPLIFFGLLIATGLLVVVGYVFKARNGHVGMTTEAAILVTVLLGGLCYWNFVGVAVAIAVVTTLLLSLKLETDRLVESLTRKDVNTALQFAIVSAIVLPVLPNQSFFPPPFDVLNPFKIWLMVVFISGISFLGYVLIKVLKGERGLGMTGFLGGLVSSTAVTLSLAQRSNKKKISRLLGFAILLSWTVMVPRVLVQVGVLNLDLFIASWLPLAAVGLVTLGYALFLYVARPEVNSEKIVLQNPFDIMTALRFGLVYAVILLVSRAAQLFFGVQGVLLSSFLAGFSDLNAITLSLAELSRSGGLSEQVATQGLVIAASTNTLFKGLIVMQLGSPALRKVVLPGMILVLAVGLTCFLLL
jgi:uncharacterized membrane protein (DUF4010 family)